THVYAPDLHLEQAPGFFGKRAGLFHRLGAEVDVGVVRVVRVDGALRHHFSQCARNTGATLSCVSMRWRSSANAGLCSCRCARAPAHLDTTTARKSSAPGVAPFRKGEALKVSAKTSQCLCRRARVPARMASSVSLSSLDVKRSG